MIGPGCKSWPFKSKNNAQALLKLHQNNFEKVQKSTFLTPKMVKLCSFLTHFWVYFQLKRFINDFEKCDFLSKFGP